jgi:hypothetical protein
MTKEVSDLDGKYRFRYRSMKKFGQLQARSGEQFRFGKEAVPGFILTRTVGIQDGRQTQC